MTIQQLGTFVLIRGKAAGSGSVHFDHCPLGPWTQLTAQGRKTHSDCELAALCKRAVSAAKFAASFFRSGGETHSGLPISLD